MQKILTAIKKPLLLSPAGSPYKAIVAFEFGADAIYCGTAEFGLRASDGFTTIEQIAETIKKAHSLHKKVFVTLNSSIHQNDSENFKQHIFSQLSIKPDALILSDPAVIEIIHSLLDETSLHDFEKNAFEKKTDESSTDLPIENLKNTDLSGNNLIGNKALHTGNSPETNENTIQNLKKSMPGLHLSTQANVTNSISAKFWQTQGIQQIVFARELSLEEIFRIKKDLDNQNIPLHIETFVHGAMCISYSGRCLLSLYMTNPDLSTPNGSVNRDANRGECVHPCRWQYKTAYLTEKERPDETFELIEDNKHSYIMSSKDLCMVQHIPILMLSGIDSFKIEGRMKSSLYTAATTYVYRKAIDFAYDLLNKKLNIQRQNITEDLILKYIQNPIDFFSDFQDWSTFIKSITHYLDLFSHRPYTTGFYFPGYSFDFTQKPIDSTKKVNIQSNKNTMIDTLSTSSLASSQNMYLGDYQLVGESIDNSSFMCKNKFVPHEQKLILFSLNGLETLGNYSITEEDGTIPLFLKHSTKYKINHLLLNNTFFYFLLTSNT